MKYIRALFCAYRGRLLALSDKSALFLMLPAMAILAVIDAPRVAAVFTWMLFGAVMVGFCVQISRIVWPGVDLPALLAKAKEEPLPAAIVVAAVILFVAILFLSLALWTKP